MRLPTGDNYLFSFPSFPSFKLIKTLITHSTRIKFKPKEEKCTYAEVTPGKQWVELGCHWCQLCQVAVGTKLLVIITAGFIILISCHFYMGLKKLCLWDFGDKSRCGVFRTNVYRGGTYVSGGQSSQKPNLEVWKVRTLLCNICSAGPRKLLTIWSIFPNASQSFSIYKSTGWLCQGRKTSPCWQPNSTRNSNNLISTGRSIQQ